MYIVWMLIFSVHLFKFHVIDEQDLCSLPSRSKGPDSTCYGLYNVENDSTMLKQWLVNYSSMDDVVAIQIVLILRESLRNDA